jgi:CRP/FNR family transcriptional regulator, cyclic AMP receptor protein
LLHLERKWSGPYDTLQFSFARWQSPGTYQCETESALWISCFAFSFTQILGAILSKDVIALLGPTDFFGEGCIAGQPLRVASAIALEPTTVLETKKSEMIRVIHEEHEFSDRFIAHMLKRNVRFEEDLVDQLFNSSEKRLARTLLLVARYGNNEKAHHVVARISQETLAEMVGTTRSRVSFFMNKFRKLGFIKYNGGLQINDSLLRVLLRE